MSHKKKTESHIQTIKEFKKLQKFTNRLETTLNLLEDWQDHEERSDLCNTLKQIESKARHMLKVAQPQDRLKPPNSNAYDMSKLTDFSSFLDFDDNFDNNLLKEYEKLNEANKGLTAKVKQLEAKEAQLSGTILDLRKKIELLNDVLKLKNDLIQELYQEKDALANKLAKKRSKI